MNTENPTLPHRCARCGQPLDPASSHDPRTCRGVVRSHVADALAPHVVALRFVGDETGAKLTEELVSWLWLRRRAA